MFSLGRLGGRPRPRRPPAFPNYASQQSHRQKLRLVQKTSTFGRFSLNKGGGSFCLDCDSGLQFLPRTALGSIIKRPTPRKWSWESHRQPSDDVIFAGFHDLYLTRPNRLQTSSTLTRPLTANMSPEDSPGSKPEWGNLKRHSSHGRHQPTTGLSWVFARSNSSS